MNEEFIKRLYDTIIIDGLEIYKNQFQNTALSEKTFEFTRKSLELYSDLSDEQKKFFFEILRVIMIDTISGVFGIFDGSSTLNDGNMDVHITINGEDTEEELQDCFLEYIEGLEI